MPVSQQARLDAPKLVAKGGQIIQFAAENGEITVIISGQEMGTFDEDTFMTFISPTFSFTEPDRPAEGEVTVPGDIDPALLITTSVPLVDLPVKED